MVRRTILGRNKLSSIHVHNKDLCLILRKARLFEANKHFLSNLLASEYLIKKKEKNRRGWASCSIGHRKSIPSVIFCFLTLIWKIVFEPNWQPLPAIHGTHCEVLYVHVLKRYVQYLLLPYLSVDIVLCAIGHRQEELQYVDSYQQENILITSIFLICSLCPKVSYLSS